MLGALRSTSGHERLVTPCLLHGGEAAQGAEPRRCRAPGRAISSAHRHGSGASATGGHERFLPGAPRGWPRRSYACRAAPSRPKGACRHGPSSPASLCLSSTADSSRNPVLRRHQVHRQEPGAKRQLRGLSESWCRQLMMAPARCARMGANEPVRPKQACVHFSSKSSSMNCVRLCPSETPDCVIAGSRSLNYLELRLSDELVESRH